MKRMLFVVAILLVVASAGCVTAPRGVSVVDFNDERVIILVCNGTERLYESRAIALADS